MSLCNNRIVCPGSDSPYANLSSEASDPFLFIGINHCGGYPKLYFSPISQEDADLGAAGLCPVQPVGTFAPAGGVGPDAAYPDPSALCLAGCPDATKPDPDLSRFTNTAQTCDVCCVAGPCVSFTMEADKIQGRSQEEADFWAKTFACRSAVQLALLQCPGATCLVIDGITVCETFPPPYNPPAAIAIYWNGPQSCEAQCPDGTINVYTVQPGRFSGRNQLQADTAAATYACRQAYRNRFCVTDLQGGCCLGSTPTFTITAFGGSGSVSWAFQSGTLPDGMTAAVSGRTVTITGTPSTPGLFTFSFQVSDTAGHTVIKSFSITVLGIVEGFSLPSASNAVPYTTTLTAAGGTAPYVFALVSGALPTGLSIASDGTISGTPSEPTTANFPFVAKVTDATGAVCAKALNIFVQGGCIIADASPLPAFDQGQPYSHQMTTSGGVGPFTWVKTAGLFPFGVTMSSSGLISGTPLLTNGNLDATFTLRVTAADLTTCEASFTLPVLDYHDYPPGNKWRIKNYNPANFDSSCCQSVTAIAWDGAFKVQLGAALFKQGPSDAMSTNGVFSPGGTFMALQQGQILAPTAEWWVLLYCFPGASNRSVWEGKKIGSNAGAKLDSPAGIYTLDLVETAAQGRTPCGAAPATIEIEEY